MLVPLWALTEGARRGPLERGNPSKASAEQDERTGEIALRAGRLELRISTEGGVMSPRLLLDREGGRAFADFRYCYGGVDGELPRLLGEPRLRGLKDGSVEVSLVGRLGGLRIEHIFVALPDAPAIEEKIRLTNEGGKPVETAKMAFGFAKLVFDGKRWFEGVEGTRFVAIPYRREPETGELCDYEIEEVVWRKGWFFVKSRRPRHYHEAFGSEGWAWVDKDGDDALLIAKHNPRAMEWSLLKPLWTSDGRMVLCFGGAGLWKLGDPEPAARLDPGGSFEFGTTRYELCSGGWKGAFYAFRRWMDSLGHRFPPNYDPPVHWNELYDNPLWWGPDTPERRAKFYRLEDMLVEAEKAGELGCDALYLDPGWDTVMGSSIWAEDRLGPEREFCRTLKERYGLKLALHTPLAAWNDPSTYPREAWRRAKDGSLVKGLCSASRAYIEEKARRLVKLCEDGAVFLMFDGSGPTGECYDPAHGHSLPPTRHEHCMACLRLTQMVKKRFPNVLIELHDPIVAGVNVRYAPTYFLHGLPNSFDEIWGFEYMWDPMADLLSGRALSLYYVNLAYNIPIYLHIDLRKDNENALIFWWYASTCRHLGVGGKSPNPKVWEAHKRAMKTYKALKEFFCRGEFYGLGEEVHAHTLPDRGEAVINVFNLADVSLTKEIRFRPEEIGLPEGSALTVEGAPFAREGEEVVVTVTLPARGHKLLRAREARR